MKLEKEFRKITVNKAILAIHIRSNDKHSKYRCIEVL